MNILIISGHNDLNNSVANTAILDETARQLPEAEVRKLDALYPDYRINVEAEQEALRKADLIVWQFPFYWYSLPALMKKWLDEVFVHGFAHGSTAVLGGKKFLVSFTTGAPAEFYTGKEGSVGDIHHMIEMFSATAMLCRLDYQGAMWLNGVSYANRQTEEAIRQQQAEARKYAGKLIARIKEIAKG